jgi:hypothetical protein
MDVFMKLDIFRKLPRDLTEPTFCGALVSIVCSVVLVLLGISEVKTYMSNETSSTMFIQTSHKLDTIRVNLDIDMPFMPCDVIGVDVEDSIGNHI